MSARRQGTPWEFQVLTAHEILDQFSGDDPAKHRKQELEELDRGELERLEASARREDPLDTEQGVQGLDRERAHLQGAS